MTIIKEEENNDITTTTTTNNNIDYYDHHHGKRKWFGLVSLFNGISTLCRLFNAKAILLEEQ